MSGNKGCIYWDESSRGLRPNGKVDKRGRWVAEISVDGRLRRMRSADLGRCKEFLKEWQQKAVGLRHELHRRVKQCILYFCRKALPLRTGH